MNFNPDYEKGLYRYSPEDLARFTEWTGYLPPRKDSTPFHSGPHSLRAMEMAYKFCGSPANVMEIGFCLGHSATIWLELGAKAVTSIENSDREETIEAAQRVDKAYPGRFQFLRPEQTFSKAKAPFGMAYIDGAHDLESVSYDLETALLLNVPYLVFDDVGEKWGPGVEPAIHARGLVIDAIFGNLAVCRPPQKDWISA